jgi:hypothetical protein
MESILLTLDVACMILLLRNVLRVINSGNSSDLGIFSYPSDSTIVKPAKGKTGVPPNA